MIVGILATVIYFAGVYRTIEHHVDTVEYSLREGYFPSLAWEWYAALTACLWPAYWPIKFLAGVTDRLQLPPGDGV